MRKLISMSILGGLSLAVVNGALANQAEVSLTDDGELLIDVTTGDILQLDTALVFFDTDQNLETGYRPAGREEAGAEMMISGDGLYEFAGSERNVWTWQRVGDVDMQRDGSRQRIHVPADRLNADRLRVGVWLMSPDWMEPVDILPPEGWFDIEIGLAAADSAIVSSTTAGLTSLRPNRHLPARERAKQATSFYCYYGPNRVHELSRHDLVILESKQQKAEDIETLKSLGVVTVAYMSVGEDESLRRGNGAGPGGYAGWYFDRNEDGEPDQNGIWKSFFVDARDSAWRQDRLDEARRILEHEGYDGIFLDTIDTHLRYPESRQGMVELIKMLRQRFPDNVILLNQGYTLFGELAPIADGLVMEDFSLGYDFAGKQYVKHGPVELDFSRKRMQGPRLAGAGTISLACHVDRIRPAG